MRRGQLRQGLLARGPGQQAELAEPPDRVVEIRVGAFDGLVRLAALPPARTIQATPETARSIPFSASHAWISTSDAPRSRRLNALTTPRAAAGSTTSTPSSPRPYPTGILGCG